MRRGETRFQALSTFFLNIIKGLENSGTPIQKTDPPKAVSDPDSLIVAAMPDFETCYEDHQVFLNQLLEITGDLDDFKQFIHSDDLKDALKAIKTLGMSTPDMVKLWQATRSPSVFVILTKSNIKKYLKNSEHHGPQEHLLSITELGWLYLACGKDETRLQDFMKTMGMTLGSKLASCYQNNLQIFHADNLNTPKLFIDEFLLTLTGRDLDAFVDSPEKCSTKFDAWVRQQQAEPNQFRERRGQAKYRSAYHHGKATPAPSQPFSSLRRLSASEEHSRPAHSGIGSQQPVRPKLEKTTTTAPQAFVQIAPQQRYQESSTSIQRTDVISTAQSLIINRMSDFETSYGSDKVFLKQLLEFTGSLADFEQFIQSKNLKEALGAIKALGMSISDMSNLWRIAHSASVFIMFTKPEINNYVKKSELSLVHTSGSQEHLLSMSELGWLFLACGKSESRLQTLLKTMDVTLGSQLASCYAKHSEMINTIKLETHGLHIDKFLLSLKEQDVVTFAKHPRRFSSTFITWVGQQESHTELSKRRDQVQFHSVREVTSDSMKQKQRRAISAQRYYPSSSAGGSAFPKIPGRYRSGSTAHAGTHFSRGSTGYSSLNLSQTSGQKNQSDSGNVTTV